MYTPKRQDVKFLNRGRFDRRLAPKVADDDCWIWASTCMKRVGSNSSKIRKMPCFPIVVDHPDGSRGQKMVYARRWIWEETFGALQDKMRVVNVCGNDTCVRPDPRHNRVMENGRWLYADVEDPTTPSTFAAERQKATKRLESLIPQGFTLRCDRCGARVHGPYCHNCGNAGS